MTPSDHPAFKRTYWVNLYKDGGFSGTLWEQPDAALESLREADGKLPEGVDQVEVKIVPVNGNL